MVEGEQGMPTPEQERPLSAEQARKPSFEERLRGLIEPKKDEEGKVLQEAVIRNEKLQRLGRLALESRNQTPEDLGKFLGKGDDWCLNEQVPEDEWSVLAGELSEEKERLLREIESRKGIIGTPEALEKEGEVQQAMLEAYKRLSPEQEKERWVDVELAQEFWSRFTPTMEPRFYTEASSEERKDWDARWQLARAAFYKKRLSAFPAELTKNEDLQLLTPEQMERLYYLPGVKEAMEWYVKQIVNSTHEIYFDEKTGRRLNEEEVSKLSKEERIKRRKTFLDCANGYQFEEFKRDLREKEKFLREKKRWYEGKRGERIERGEERELSELERKSADAIAWNFIWCTNLIESVDSRYSLVGESGLRKRHDNLSPEQCSDDLRAVFHPQEKFENKCASDQEWGAYGKWGLLQLRRVKEECNFRSEDEEDAGTGEIKRKRDRIVFREAKLRRDFWRGERKEEGTKTEEGEVVVLSPECYPITTMKSFLETYECRDKEGRKTSLLDHFLKGDEIDWRTLRANPWQTNYLTIILPKAVSLFDIFKSGKTESGWTSGLLDIYTRLEVKKELEEYYEKKKRSKKEGERLGAKHFHNLKVWAYFAPFGGVGRPQDKIPVDPFSTAKIRIEAKRDLSDREYILRKPQNGYLGRGEHLTIEDIS